MVFTFRGISKRAETADPSGALVENHSKKGPLNGRSLGYAPWISCRARGVEDLHAALFKESRTRGRCQQREVGNPGTLRSR